MFIISSRVALRLGMVTPLLARAAIPIILWKDGCSRACIGLIDEARLETRDCETRSHTWSVAISHSIAASQNTLFE